MIFCKSHSMRGRAANGRFVSKTFLVNAPQDSGELIRQKSKSFWTKNSLHANQAHGCEAEAHSLTPAGLWAEAGGAVKTGLAMK